MLKIVKDSTIEYNVRSETFDRGFSNALSNSENHPKLNVESTNLSIINLELKT